MVVHTRDIPDLESLDAVSCYLAWDILLTTDKGENAIKDVFIFVEDDCELTVEPVYDDRTYDAEPARLGPDTGEPGQYYP